MDFSLHPLNIELVVRNIFKYLPISFIKTCRCVSSTWNQAASVTLLQKSSLPIIISCDNLTPINVLASSENFPCDKFIIQLNHQLLPTNVFELVGKYATQLKFSFCVGSINRPDINPYNFTTFSKLTELCVSFRIINRNAHEQNVGLDIIWKILQTSPNLKNITLRYCDSSLVPVIIHYIKATSSCHKIESLSISKLIFTSEFDDAQLYQIAGIPLKVLKLGFGSRNGLCQPEMINKLLVALSATLEILEIYYQTEKNAYQIHSDPPFVFEFPYMPCLKVLKMRSIRVNNLSFKYQLPVLEKLCIGSLTRFLFPCDSLKELVSTHGWNSEIRNWQIARYFPNVKRVQIPQDFIDVAGQIWPNLEKLTVVAVEQDADPFSFGVREEVPGTVRFYKEIRQGFEQGQNLEEIRKMYIESGEPDALFEMNKLKILKIKWL